MARKDVPVGSLELRDAIGYMEADLAAVGNGSSVIGLVARGAADVTTPNVHMNDFRFSIVNFSPIMYHNAVSLLYRFTWETGFNQSLYQHNSCLPGSRS